MNSTPDTSPRTPMRSAVPAGPAAVTRQSQLQGTPRRRLTASMPLIRPNSWTRCSPQRLRRRPNKVTRGSSPSSSHSNCQASTAESSAVRATPSSPPRPAGSNHGPRSKQHPNDHGDNPGSEPSTLPENHQHDPDQAQTLRSDVQIQRTFQVIHIFTVNPGSHTAHARIGPLLAGFCPPGRAATAGS
ncbi:MAG: hypothetical protein JWN05_2697 [Arthrobacter sp.]|jgi:hypothetical protein|nr:hypothetical protein [Arthrobacter sp.]